MTGAYSPAVIDWNRYPLLHLASWSHRRLLFVGGSTLRMMVTDLMLEAPLTRTRVHFHGMPDNLRESLQCPSSWEVLKLPCNATLGAGCPDCVCCCGALQCGERRNDRATALNITTPHKLTTMRSKNELIMGWSDFDAHCTALNVTIIFSWKPELVSMADHAAFRTRFCRTPPHVLVLGKGLHDVVYRPEWLSNATARTRDLASLTRCLPPSTLTVVRTPYATRRSGKAILRVKNRTQLDHVRRRIKAVHADGDFGAAALVDAFDLTNQNGAPAPYDGIHYPSPVQFWVWWLIEREWLRWTRN